jgi:superfamily I DNA/RNA helicase
MPKVSKIIGPPGCGKTTQLLQYVDAAVKKHGSDAVGATSYTKASVETIVKRVQAAGFAVPTNVRTLHSHCFRLLRLKDDQVCEPDKKRNFRLFTEAHPEWEMDNPLSTEDDRYYNNQGASPNAEVYNRMQNYRHMCLPIDKWDDTTVSLYNAWIPFLKENDFYDYSLMLEECIHRELAPSDVVVLFVDEAQDLTLLQYKLVQMWMRDIDSTVFFGDSCQSIYRWAGVTPEVFMDIQPVWKILDQSYRIPQTVQEYSINIISAVLRREDAPYKPTSIKGNVYHCSEPDLSLPGTHMLIARTNRNVGYWVRYLIENNTIWHNPLRPKDTLWNPTASNDWKAYGIFKKLQKQKINGLELQHLASQITVRDTMERGLKAKIARWNEDETTQLYSFLDLLQLGFTPAFLEGKIPPKLWLNNSAQYIQNIENLYIPTVPNVILGTIHSVKGGEADHVWVDSTISKFMAKNIDADYNIHDEECRIAYVAATRARHTLGILDSRNKYYSNPFLF